MVIEKWYNRMMATLTNHIIGWGGSTLCKPLAIGDFYDVFLPNIGKGQKEVVPSEHRAPGILPYGKSGPGCCITFIKRLDEGLR